MHDYEVVDATAKTHNHEMIQAVQRRDALERQQEILFDIAFNLGASHNPLGQATSDLMDWLGGSRELFERVKTWAGEFDVAWESQKASGVENDDYLTEIDTFTSVKWAALEREYEEDQKQVCGVQVVPVIHEGKTIIPQFNGPTDETTGWSVYTRDPVGMAHWFADLGDEESAMWLGAALAVKHSVKIEPQLWNKKEKSDDQVS